MPAALGMTGLVNLSEFGFAVPTLPYAGIAKAYTWISIASLGAYDPRPPIRDANYTANLLRMTEKTIAAPIKGSRESLRAPNGLRKAATLAYTLSVFLVGYWFPKFDWLLEHTRALTPFDFTADLSPSQAVAIRCPQQPPLLDIGAAWDLRSQDDLVPVFAKRLSEAVQLDTVSFDRMPIEAADPAFDKHYAFSRWLRAEYSKLYADPLQHEYINTHSHLFTWKGSDSSLRPILLMAHTDTVPVASITMDQWTFPPWQGEIASDVSLDTPGTWVWGRGASDCKNQLLGILNAVERLVSEGHRPERTILIATGFDEEVGGLRGAGEISQTLQKRYGPDSLAFALDEGFSGIGTEFGATVASLGMAEKGYLNMLIQAEAPGGHSSVPPEHTAIGVIAKILTALEENPFRPTLDPKGPFIKHLSCLVELAPGVPPKLKKDLKNPKKWDMLARDLAGGDRILNSYLSTTQAIDVIVGGVKFNALPEHVEAIVNYRISFTSSVAETIRHLVQTIEPIVNSFNYTLSPFDGSQKTSSQHVTLKDADTERLDPAPITSADDPSFALIGGTIKAVFGEETLITPTGMYANTDTRKMWNLTSNLYRFTPAFLPSNLNVHGVDEVSGDFIISELKILQKMPFEGYLNTTRFMYKLIRNLEGWRGLD